MISKNKAKINANYFNIKVYGRGLIRGYLIFSILFLITAALITYTNIGENIIPLITSIIMIVGISYGAIYTSVHLKNKGWLHGGIVGLIYVIILILLSKIFISNYSLDKLSIYKLGLGTLSGVLAGMLGVNIK